MPEYPLTLLIVRNTGGQVEAEVEVEVDGDAVLSKLLKHYGTHDGDSKDLPPANGTQGTEIMSQLIEEYCLGASCLVRGFLA